MANEIIYSIGEAILLEVDGVTDVSYPKGEDVNTLVVIMEDGKRYKLILKSN